METWQYHPSDDHSLIWDNATWSYGSEEWIYDFDYVKYDGSAPTATGSAIIVADGDLYSKVLTIHADSHWGWSSGTTKLTNVEVIGGNYFSFNITEMYATYNCGEPTGEISLDIIFYDSDGSLQYTHELWTSPNITGSGTETYTDIGLHEYMVSGGQLYYVINGVSQGSISTYSNDIGYVTIQAYALSRWNCGNTGCYRRIWASIDDISSYCSVGIGVDRSPTANFSHYMVHGELDLDDQPDYPIYTTYTIKTQPSAEYTAAQYKLNVRHITNGEIVNTTIIKDAGVLGLPSGKITYNRTDIFGENYGLYQFYTAKDGVIQSYDLINWQYTSLSGNSWVDIPDTISSDTEVDIDYYIDAPEFGDYNYYIKVYDPDYAIVQSYSITIASGTETLDTSGYDSGIYIVIMTAVAKSGGNSYDIAYDMTTISDEVIVVGTTYNATDNSIVPTVNINDSQSSTWFNTTSDGSGDYELQGFSSDILTSINASKTNYTHEDFTWTPPQVGMYTMDLYLFPSNRSLTNNATILEGMVVSYPLYQGLGNATVNVYNATWSDNMTALSWGYYNFSNITAGDYTVNATLAGYTDSSEYSVTISNNNSTVKNIVLHPIFTLTVTADDSETTASLSEFTAIVNGETISTTNGTATFTLDYGLYTISVSSSGYYPNTASVLLNKDKSVEVSLTPIDSIYYNPHYVKFTIQNIWGTKYNGVDVSVYTGTETDTTFTGTTGSDGSVTFKLSETTQYRITFIDSAEGISETRTLYPVDDHYYIIVSTTFEGWDTYTVPISDAIDFTISKSIINSTHAYINVSYSDSQVETTSLITFLNQTNESDYFNQTNLDTWNAGAVSSGSYSFIVENYEGQSYIIRLLAEHTTYGTIDSTYSVSFKDDIATKFPGIPPSAFLYSSIFILLFTGGIFVKSNVEKGMLVICVMFFIFYGLGSFNTLPSNVQQSMLAGGILAFILSIIANLNKSNREEGFS